MIVVSLVDLVIVTNSWECLAVHDFRVQTTLGSEAHRTTNYSVNAEQTHAQASPPFALLLSYLYRFQTATESPGDSSTFS